MCEENESKLYVTMVDLLARQLAEHYKCVVEDPTMRHAVVMEEFEPVLICCQKKGRLPKDYIHVFYSRDILEGITGDVWIKLGNKLVEHHKRLQAEKEKGEALIVG